MNEFQGDRLKVLLKRRSLDQKRLASFLGVSETTVSQWTKQKRDPGTHHLQQMARFLNTSVDYLLGLSHNPLPRDFDYDNVPQLTALAMGYREAEDEVEKELWRNAIADAILIAEAKRRQLRGS